MSNDELLEPTPEMLKNELYPGYWADVKKRRDEAAASKAFVPPQRVASSAMKTSEMFERWAKTYGDLVKMVKATGKAKVSACESGIAPKTLAARLRDIRSAIVELGYTSPDIPAESTAIMKEKVFRELGEWVFVEDKKKKAVVADVEDLSDLQHPPFVTNSLEEAKAFLLTFNVKDENGEFIFRKIVLAVANAELFPQVLNLAQAVGVLYVDQPWIEVGRKVI